MDLEERLSKETMKGKPPDTDSTFSYSADGELPGCASTLKVPHMLISVELDQDQDLSTNEACYRWISSFPGLANQVKVDGVYQGYSTVLILSIPILIWNMLPDHPACRPIAYFTSKNLLRNNPTHYANSWVSSSTTESSATPSNLSCSFYNDVPMELATPTDIEDSVLKKGCRDSSPIADSAVTYDTVEIPGSNVPGAIMRNVGDDISSTLEILFSQKSKLAYLLIWQQVMVAENV
jgi:hypothetical protein